LSIASSLVANDALLLTLSNGAEITLLGSSTFLFDVGGAPLAPAETGMTYGDFVQGVLGVTVPEPGEPPVEIEDPIVIGEDPPGIVIDVDIDTEPFPTQADFDAGGDAYNFIDEASVSNYAVIDNFSEDDTISFVNADVDDYAFSNEGEDVTLSYNYNDEGTMNVIILTGIVSEDVLVYDLTSFTDAIGFNPFG
jgi:hypothetical protein